MDTPVALIIFNRPDTTEFVFAEIARAKPAKLLVIADGPRKDHPEDRQKCAAARAIINRVDWECEVLKNYSDVNLGCGPRPATGISWVFEHVDRAIVLEDDCVPHPTFFNFCEELLEKYRDDERVMQISGNNFQFGHKRNQFSYFFSYQNICWGWATWRRAWKYFHIGVQLWPMLKNTSWLKDIVEDPIAVEYWGDKFDRAYNLKGNIDYWDYQWAFACWSQNGLSVMPNNTLVSNIGCGEDATHTKASTTITANLPATEMEFPLQHPPVMVKNREAEHFLIEKLVLPMQKGLYRRKSPFYNMGRKYPSIIIRAIRKHLSFLRPKWP